MAKTLTPLGDRVVVKAVAQEEMTKSGLVLPGTAQEKPQEGEVIAVGPGRVLDDGKRLAMELKKGDKAGSDTDISAAKTIQAKIGDDFTRYGVR